MIKKRMAARRGPPPPVSLVVSAVFPYLSRVVLQSDSVSFLAGVEKRLNSLLPIPAAGNGKDGRHLFLDSSRHLILSEHAKRIRPLLVYFSGRIFRKEDRNWTDIAAAAELIHSASLLHDDVVDGAGTRRHRPTVNARWGNTVAILSGDWLLSLAFSLLKNMSPGIVREAIETVARMTEASIREVVSRGRLDVTLGDWRAMAQGKTGSLFEWCVRSAARDTADPESLSRLRDCTGRFSVAFQMVDDLKDVLRSASGKDSFSDLRNRELNSAVVVALGLSKNVRNALPELWAHPDPGGDRVRAMANQIAESGAIEEVRRMAEAEVRAGLDVLGEIRETPGGRQLAAWAESLMESASPGVPDEDGLLLTAESR